MEAKKRIVCGVLIELDYVGVDSFISVLDELYRREQNKKIQPKTKDELKSLIDKTIEEQGYACDLNFIDTSLLCILI